MAEGYDASGEVEGAEFGEDLEDLLGPAIGFEKVGTFRGSLYDVRPVVTKGAIEVRFLIHSLDIAALSPIIEASGRMLEVQVAKKVWARGAYFDPETGDYQDPIGEPT